MIKGDRVRVKERPNLRGTVAEVVSELVVKVELDSIEELVTVATWRLEPEE